MKDIASILDSYRNGLVDLQECIAAIRAIRYETDLGLTIDYDRYRRTGAAEVIYGTGKTTEQISLAFEKIANSGHNVLATRLDLEAIRTLQEKFSSIEVSEIAQMAWFQNSETKPASTSVAVVTAGTSDQRIAEEAGITAEFYGSPVLRIQDVGVAGIHRLFNRMDEMQKCRAIIVVAGMEGALPSVVGGLVNKPVIAVPTSVGYGASFDGLAALLGMLTSCTPGISVVNIDNGFGAGFLANRINRL